MPLKKGVVYGGPKTQSCRHLQKMNWKVGIFKTFCRTLLSPFIKAYLITNRNVLNDL